MSLKFANRATSLLAGSIALDAVALAVTAATGSRFPALTTGDWFPAMITAADNGYEIVYVTARSGDTFTIERGKEGTTARAFDAGAVVDLRLTAGAIAELVTEIITNGSTVAGQTLNDALDTLNAGKLDAADIDLQAKWSTGDVKLTMKTVADAGWVMFNDGTIGDASSGASYANASAQALFVLMFDNMVDGNAPILTSAGSATTRAAQSNAASAWAANCRISLPKALGRAIAIAGAGSGLTSRALGAIVGGETNTLITANLPPYTPAGSVQITDPGHAHGYVANYQAIGSIPPGGNDGRIRHNEVTSPATTGITAAFSGTAQGGTSVPVSNMQPTTFLNAMVKL